MSNNCHEDVVLRRQKRLRVSNFQYYAEYKLSSTKPEYFWAGHIVLVSNIIVTLQLLYVDNNVVHWFQ